MIWRRREIRIAAAIVVAGLIVVVIAARDDEPDAQARPAARTSTPGPASGDIPVTGLKLELLESPKGDLPEPERNPFRFQPRPAAPAPRPEPAAKGPAGPAPPPREATPTGPPPSPPIPLRFIGLVDAPTQAGRVAMISDGRGNVFYGKEGDIIEGRYRLLKVGTDAVELSTLDGRGRQTIRLSGQ